MVRAMKQFYYPYIWAYVEWIYTQFPLPYLHNSTLVGSSLFFNYNKLQKNNYEILQILNKCFIKESNSCSSILIINFYVTPSYFGLQVFTFPKLIPILLVRCMASLKVA